MNAAISSKKKQNFGVVVCQNISQLSNLHTAKKEQRLKYYSLYQNIAASGSVTLLFHAATYCSANGIGESNQKGFFYQSDEPIYYFVVLPMCCIIFEC